MYYRKQHLRLEKCEKNFILNHGLNVFAQVQLVNNNEQT